MFSKRFLFVLSHMLPLFPGVYPTYEICSQVYVAWRVTKPAVNRDCEIDDTFIQILLLHQTAGWNGIKMFWPFFRMVYIYIHTYECIYIYIYLYICLPYLNIYSGHAFFSTRATFVSPETARNTTARWWGLKGDRIAPLVTRFCVSFIHRSELGWQICRFRSSTSGKYFPPPKVIPIIPIILNYLLALWKTVTPGIK